MVAPLKVGLAGFGTVGASVIRLIAEGDGLAARCGRPVEVVAVSARTQGQGSRRRSVEAALVRRSGRARQRSRHRCVRRIDGRRGRSGQGRGRGRAASRQVGRHRQQGAAGAARRWRLRELAEANGVALNFEAAVGGAIPIIKTLREGLAGNSFARIYGILNGTCNYILTRMEQEKLSFAECLKDAQRLGYAEADPTFDVEGFDTAQKLAILASHRLRHQGRSRGDLCRRHFLDRAGRSRGGRRTRLSHQAARRRGEDRQRHRAARASDHGAEGFRHRAGDGRDQRRHDRRRGHRADHAGRARARAAWRPRRRWLPISAISRAACGWRRSAVRPTSLTAAGKAPMQRHEGGYYIRLLAVDKPGTAATIATRLAEQQISLESIVQRHLRAAGRQGCQGRDRPGSGDPHHLCDHRRRGAARARCGQGRQGDFRRTAIDPHRKKPIEDRTARGAG